ncbi:MAG: multifunctional oxoglutarate decarboxylase/oxoglutarate dehydrogenase thiamine pyrophosphate-binding subunit/dihydrolipoyllysine-residue succinyltransferase subunit, partial [Mycobacterium sp.]
MSSTSSPFGQNEWLVEEMYRKFREDPSSVDPSWHEFLAGYSPEATTAAPAGGNGQAGNGQAGKSQAAPPSPAVAPPPQPVPSPPAPSSAPEPAPPPAPPTTVATVPVAEPAAEQTQVLRGASAAVVKNMNVSLEIPTATSVRAIPAKLMIDNRVVANNHL